MKECSSSQEQDKEAGGAGQVIWLELVEAGGEGQSMEGLTC